MIKKYNNLSFLFGIPGIILQVAGVMMAEKTTAPGQEINPEGWALVAVLAGTLMFLVGLAYYAKAKGRSPAWCLLAFFSCFGLLILYFLKDHTATKA